VNAVREVFCKTLEKVTATDFKFSVSICTQLWGKERYEMISKSVTVA